MTAKAPSSALAEVAAKTRRDNRARLEQAKSRVRYQSDPVAYCREVLRFEPWSKQREVLESIRDHARTAVRSGHGLGKTATAACAVLWFTDCFPNALVVTSAPTWAQVERQLWREIHGAHYRARLGGNLTATELKYPDGRLAIGLSTDKPERFQGFHAPNLLLVFDEASGIDERIYEAGEGYLTAGGARILLIGNPTQVSGSFYDAFHSKRGFYNLIAISAFDSPAFTAEPVPEETLRNVTGREWVDEHKALWGEESPIYEVRVLGQFPSVSEDSVCSLGDVEKAQANGYDPDDPATSRFLPTTPVVIACDVARFGSDETVIAVRKGQQVRIVDMIRGRDLMGTAGALANAAREVAREGIDFATVVVDDAGLGGGVTDRLRELQRENVFHAIRIVAFNGAERARRQADYPNRRSEVWFAASEQLADLDLDDDEQLAADLLAPKYHLDSRGRRVVESKAETKKRLGRSPDRADAVLMTLDSPYTSAMLPDVDIDNHLDDAGGQLTGFRPGMKF